MPTFFCVCMHKRAWSKSEIINIPLKLFGKDVVANLMGNSQNISISNGHIWGILQWIELYSIYFIAVEVSRQSVLPSISPFEH